MTEHDIQTKIMIKLSEMNCIVFRRNTGVFFTIKSNWFKSKSVVCIGDWLSGNAKRITIGKKGQSDLQGHRIDGKCFYIEVKKPGECPTKEQVNFINQMKSSGALAGVAHSVEEAVAVVFGGEKQ